MRIGRRAIAGIALVATMVSAGCETQVPTTDVVIRPLPAVALREDQEGFFCAGVGMPSIVHGDPSDPEIVWLSPIPQRGGERIETIWPAGYRAVFNPALTIVDAKGAVRLDEGDFIDGACVIDHVDRLLIVPPADGFALDCGPIALRECINGPARAIGDEASANANGRRIDLIRFLNSTGKFQVVYQDGSTSEGFTDSL
jgi:hypothetical protein